MNEEAPTNAIGSGNIAGSGGAGGEPGVKKTSYKKKNAAEAPDPVMSAGPLRRSFKQFIQGK